MVHGAQCTNTPVHMCVLCAVVCYVLRSRCAFEQSRSALLTTTSPIKLSVRGFEKTLTDGTGVMTLGGAAMATRVFRHNMSVTRLQRIKLGMAG